MPSTKSMTKLSNWLHLAPGILQQGRTKHVLPPTEEEGEDEDERMKKEMAKDPFDARLKPIETDSKIKGGHAAWILRSYNINSDIASERPG